MSANPIAAALSRQAMALEAASSVALSHPSSCRCLSCRAADGDEDALARVIEILSGPR